MVTDEILQIRGCDPHRPRRPSSRRSSITLRTSSFIIRRTVFSETFKISAASETVYSGSSFFTDSSLMPVDFVSGVLDACPVTVYSEAAGYLKLGCLEVDPRGVLTWLRTEGPGGTVSGASLCRHTLGTARRPPSSQTDGPPA